MELPRFSKYLVGVIVVAVLALLAIMMVRELSAGAMNILVYVLLVVFGGGVSTLAILAFLWARRPT